MVSRHSHSDTSRAITVVAGQRDCAGGWLQWPFARDGAALRLLCFHHAGGGAAVYRRWGHDLSSSMEVAAVQLPGRANRLAEPPIADVPSLVDALVSNLAPHLVGRFAFFGHSMGAFVAFEIACELRRQGWALPELMMISLNVAELAARSVSDMPNAFS